MCLDVIDEFRGRRTWRKDFADAGFLERRNIRLRNDAAADDEDVVHAFSTDEIDDLREEMRMCARKDGHRDDVDVFLKGSFCDLLRRAAKTRVNNLKTCVAKCASNDLCAAVMTVKTWLSNENFDFLIHFIFPPTITFVM